MENGGAKTVDSGEARLRALGEDDPRCMPHVCPACLLSCAQQLWHPDDATWAHRSGKESCISMVHTLADAACMSCPQLPFITKIICTS